MNYYGPCLCGTSERDDARERDDVPTTSACGIESAVRLLIHARNSHGDLRESIRAAIHLDLNVLRGLNHG